MARDTLWTSDRETYWALSAVANRRKGWRPQPGQQYRAGGRRVIHAGVSNHPYGRAVSKPITDRTVSHIAEVVLFAWRDGGLLGSMAVWLCGSTSTGFQLEDEIVSRPCPGCFLRRMGPIVIDNSIVIFGGAG